MVLRGKGFVDIVLTAAGEEEEQRGPSIQLAMWELRVGSGFGGIVLRELLKAYSECKNGTDMISVQNEWLSQQTSHTSDSRGDGKGERSEPNNENDGSSSGSEDGLPPLERNMNHLYLEESEEESE
ncbi:UNVERIFIED_CONTAM: hypothetical protein Sradi_4112600 [Sesamum radiatum]|uniref:Uncharacterized protein n=1 Tax=Sesamum radiatum TaxID=300843 RepID=A0AAW2P1C6_SESRA